MSVDPQIYQAVCNFYLSQMSGKTGGIIDQLDLHETSCETQKIEQDKWFKTRKRKNDDKVGVYINKK